ncbi:MAG: hypothetical protein EHM24_15500 [Acidobacteria bacterium]|nr:MAG: hypothetical protein EHM24_15500 [Acidobacteriota bacterium]
MTIRCFPPRPFLLSLGLALVLSLAGSQSHAPLRAQSDPNAALDPALFKELKFRSVGPHRGGRVTAVAGHRRQLATFYMGATGGGVWKTTDSGATWANISDGFFSTGSIGAIDVAESNPDVIYVGTGSAAIRSNVIQGRGVYKSTDAGRTWTFVGLRDSGQIGALKVHPQNPDVAYVAVLGQAFGPSPERGVFKTTDGGKTWTKSLFVNDHTGVVSIAMNPANPDEIYAGAWRGERRPWTIISGGPASEGGIYKTSDGGRTWTHLSAGLPKNLVGKVGVDVSAANPKRVYAVLEAPGTEAGVYRSDDAGATWAQVSSQSSLIARPFYYTYIDADPKDENTVYVNNLGFWKTTDGGKTWRSLPTPHGDNQGIWINPDQPQIMVQSNDGGVNVTTDGGRTWSTQLNQPTAEIYQVAVDNQFPYRLYGAQQDNTTVIVPSLPATAIGVDHPVQTWTQGPGCETGPIMPKIDDPSIVYGACKGEFSRMNMRVGQEQARWVHPQNRYGHASRDIKYRFQRVSPMETSPHDPRVVYYCSHIVHRSRDEGVTWEDISPDLTANEPDKQGISGEPITRDITGEEVYSTIYAFRESPLEKGILWAGSNDGPVHVSRDDGKTWKNVTPKDLAPGGRVQNIEVSPHRRGSAYIAVYRYLLSDWQPYIYRTNDYGATWTRLTTGKNGIPADYPTRVVREDPDREGLLYAGTEFGFFVSFDNGTRWQPFQQNLPVTPVTDLRVHKQDLVISTMGRGFWILDNVTPLHQAAMAVAGGLKTSDWKPGVLAPRAAWRTRHQAMGSRPDQPQYPAPGAIVDYYLASEPSGEVTIEILDAGGKVVRSYVSQAGTTPAPAERAGAPADEDMPRRGGGIAVRVLKSPGLHRITWDLRYGTGAADTPRGGGGPLAVPGKYQVRFMVGDLVETKPLELRLDPRVVADGVTQADLEEQFDFLLQVAAAQADARATAARVAQAVSRVAGQPGKEAAAKTLRNLQAALVTAGGAYPQPMLIDQLSSVARMAGAADMKIGRSLFGYLEELKKRLDGIKGEFEKVSKS